MKRYLCVGLMLWLLSGTVFAQESGLPELEPLDASYEDNLPEPLTRLGYGYPGQIKWLPDGKTFAVGSSIGVWFYQADNLDAEPRLISTAPEEGYVFALNADGRLMATGHLTTRLWDVATGERLEVMETGEEVGTLAFSPDNRLLVVGMGWRSDGGMQLWDVTTGRFVKNMNTQYYFNNIAFTADSQHLISRNRISDCCEATVMWDIETGEPTTISENVFEFTLSPDGTQMMQQVDVNNVVITDLNSTIDPVTLQLPPSSTQVPQLFPFWTNDARLLIYRDSTLFWIERNRHEIMKTISLDLEGRLFEVSASADGKKIAIIDQWYKLHLVDTNTGNTVSYQVPVMKNTTALSPDGTRLAAMTVNDDIWIWDVLKNERLYTLNEDGVQFTSLTFADNDTLITIDTGNAVRVWNLTDQQQKTLFISPTYIRALYPGENDELLVISSTKVQLYHLDNGAVYPLCINPETDEPLMELNGYFDYGALDYHGQTLITLNSNLFSIWNREECADTFTQIPTNNKDSYYYDLHITGDAVYVGSWGAMVEAWSLPDFAQHWTVTPHNKMVTSLAVDDVENEWVVSASCARLVEGGYDWVCAGSELRFTRGVYSFPVIIPNTHTGRISEMQMNREHRYFVTASDDGTVVIWGNPAR